MTSTALTLEQPASELIYTAGQYRVARHTDFSVGSSIAEGGTSNRAEGRFAAVVRKEALHERATKAAVAPRANVEHQRVVRVDVQDVGDDVAHCQILQLGGQDVSIALPLVLFPTESPPFFGRSYDLEMVVDDGIRRPVLTARAPNLNALREKKQALWEMVERLTGN